LLALAELAAEETEALQMPSAQRSTRCSLSVL